MPEKVLFNELTFIIAVATHPRLLHRPDLPVIFSLPLENLLDLSGSRITRSISPRLPIWRMRFVDDLLFNLFLPLQHAVVSFRRGDAPGVDIRVKLYVLGILDSQIVFSLHIFKNF